MINCTLHADANTGHAFGIFMASDGALRIRLWSPYISNVASLAIDASTPVLLLALLSFLLKGLRVTTCRLGKFRPGGLSFGSLLATVGAKVPFAIALLPSVLQRPVHYGAVVSHRTWHPAVMAVGHHCLALASFAANLTGTGHKF